jgi:WD40 repeat protein
VSDRIIKRKPLVVAVSMCILFVGIGILFVQSRNPPADRTISSLALSASGKWLAAGTAHGNVTIWDQAHTDIRRQIVFARGSLNDLQFSPDDKLLAVASKDLGLFVLGESTPPRLLRSDNANYGSVRFSPDGKRLLVINGAGEVETVDISSGAGAVKFCCSSVYGEAVFTPDGQTIANAGHWPRLWDASSGELRGQLTADREFPTFRAIAFAPRRNAVLMGSQDGRVYVWDLTSRQRIRMSPAQTSYVDTVAVAANGSVIYAGFGNDLQLWNPDTGEHRSFQGVRPTSNVLIGADGASVLFGTVSGSVEFWDSTTGTRLRSVVIGDL